MLSNDAISYHLSHYLMVSTHLLTLTACLLLTSAIFPSYSLANDSTLDQQYPSSANLTTNAVVGNVWPMPRDFSTGNHTLELGQDFRLDCVALDTEDAQALLSSTCHRYQIILDRPDGLLPEDIKETYLNKLTHLKVQVQSSNTRLDDQTDESYDLRINDQGDAILEAKTVYGAMRGLETFSQVVRRTSQTRYLPGVPLRIKDAPAYTHRGLLLDTARSYFTIDDIKRQLDAMAVSKLNVFHWHIIDSQSFPLVSQVHPELSKYGAYASDMVYTKEDIQDIIQYARERGIRVIPEFDTPGHTYVWGLSHPNLIVCPNVQPHWTDMAPEPPSGQLNIIQESTLKLVKDLLSEQFTWFTDPYVHLGGDEVNTHCYESHKETAEYMKQHQITAKQLIGSFIQRLHQITRQNNKTPVTWEEALLNYEVNMDPNTIVQVWTNSENVKKVVEKKLRTIVSPANFWYLDCGQGAWINTERGGTSWCDPFKTWQHIYTYDPLEGLEETGNTDESHPLILGGEVAMWTEKTDPIILDMKIWPRAAAAGEVLWSGRRDIRGNLRTTSEAYSRIFKLRRRLIQYGLRPDVISMFWCEQHPNDCQL
jgi:hexosaminidase